MTKIVDPNISEEIRKHIEETASFTVSDFANRVRNEIDECDYYTWGNNLAVTAHLFKLALDVDFGRSGGPLTSAIWAIAQHLQETDQGEELGAIRRYALRQSDKRTELFQVSPDETSEDAGNIVNSFIDTGFPFDRDYSGRPVPFTLVLKKDYDDRDLPGCEIWIACTLEEY